MKQISEGKLIIVAYIDFECILTSTNTSLQFSDV